MKLMKLLVCGVVGAALLGGCCCNPGYFAPPYKPVISGCVPAFVPAR